MTRTRTGKFSRRSFLRFAGGAAAFGPFFLFSPHALASPKTLKIAKWAHFLPEFDDWFVKVWAADWGKQNNTNVVSTDGSLSAIFFDGLNLAGSYNRTARVLQLPSIRSHADGSILR